MIRIVAILLSVSALALAVDKQNQEPATPPPPPPAVSERPVNPHQMICVKVRHDLLRCANPDSICYMRLDRDALSCFARTK